MYYLNNKLRFFPTDLVCFMESEYASWMERHHKENRDSAIEPDETDALSDAIQRKGYRHEEEVLQSFKAQGKQVVSISNELSPDQQEVATIDAMRSGAEIIFQARLSLDEFGGLSDFLVKVPGNSTLGDYHYEVWDAKLSRQAKAIYAVQLCCYAEMLNQIQGCIPEHLVVILGDGKPQRLRTEEYYYYYLHLKQAFLHFQNQYAEGNMPDPAYERSFGRWSDYAKTQLTERDHLSQIANITRGQIKNLEKAGIKTISDLAATKNSTLPKIQERVLYRLKHQAILQQASKGKEKPEFEVITGEALGGHPGLSMLPPASRLDIYFDMEGYPLVEGGLEYLFGVTYVENGQNQFIDWWAHSQEQEKQAFEGFIDWAFARWQQDPDMHIYHYGHYEVTAMRKLMGRYGTREMQVDQLLRHEVFIDLYDLIRHGVRIGEPRYSIKNVEHIYRGKREGDVTDAGMSVAFYEQWIIEKDGESWEESKLLNDIRDYNIDDCDSTLECTEWLRELQQSSGVAWRGAKEHKELDEDKQEEINAITRLRDSMLDDVEPDSVQATLGWLLEFHRRESKPVFWKMFQRQTMNEEELYEDLDCLASVVRTDIPPETVKRSLVYEYSFDPDQDTKLHKGSKCMLADDTDTNLVIYDFDRAAGRVFFKVAKTKDIPDYMNLIPNEHFPAKPLPEAIWDYVDNWKNGHVLSKAVDDFLHRRRPDIGDDGGAIIKPGEDPLQGAIRVVKHLQNSALCVQGPPGAGKSYTGSHIILDLLRSGKRVGITSNSHKAINHLMMGVHNLAAQAGESYETIKIQSKTYELLADDDSIRHVASMSDFDAFPQDCQLMGGTAWTFANQKAVEQYDYLFIDEAGQVSIANLVAMGRCTRNIVLMGDQMQLGQPIQGSHPGESGKSILEYYLQDHATIPTDLGIFLGTTWRMHPDVCHFISNAVYEGRLHSEEHTVNQLVKGNIGKDSLIQKESGIVYVPIEHEGNVQGSDEEVEAILSLVEELKTREYFDSKNVSQGKIGLKDILFVAPYNYQVRKLQQALGPDAKVGSVDKFQGQEAPIVIISMCASEVDDSPRGLSFIFDKNRLNVAISRAMSMAIVVGNPGLAKSPVNSLDQMALVNLYCRVIVEAGSQ